MSNLDNRKALNTITLPNCAGTTSCLFDTHNIGEKNCHPSATDTFFLSLFQNLETDGQF